MTTAEKLSMLKTFLKITGTASDTELSVYLDFAKRELIAWRYGYCAAPPIAKAVNSAGNAVAVSASVFYSAIQPTSGDLIVFTYSGTSWQYDIEIEEVLTATDIDLADYGISMSGTPVDGDTITVRYTDAPLAEYDTVQVMACVVGYGISGAEGQKGHSENGISRTFEYADMVAYIHNNVIPYVAVM